MSVDDGGRRDRRAGSRLGWPVGAVFTVLVLLLVPLAYEPRMYFYGDTPGAYYGWWYHLGDQIRAGHWPQLDPQAWRAGNVAAEGQWGLYSPLVMALGLLAGVTDHAVVLSSCVKIVLTLVGSLGVFAVARSYGAPGAAACVAAVAAPMGGMTQYLDLPSWSAALMIWALTPWVWWAIRRTMEGANPLVALGLAYLLVTVGYVYGTIMLIFVLLACLLECRLTGDRPAGLRVFGIGVVSGLVALAVYLPGVLSVGVTVRKISFNANPRFTTDLLQIITSVLPTASVHGTTSQLLPYAYAAWFLPLLAWVDWRRVRATWRPLSGLLFLTVAMLVLLNGPSTLGPLRWPLRMQPFLVQMLVILCAVLVGRYAVRRPSPRRLAVTLVWVGVAVVVAAVRAPEVWGGHVTTGLVIGAVLTALWMAVRRLSRPVVAVAVVMVLTTAGLAFLQDAYYPSPPSPRRNMPATLAEYRTQLGTAEGDAMVVGDVGTLLEDEPDAAADFLVGSAWYLNPRPVQNTYTTISFRPYYNRYCMYYDGDTCPELLDVLFTVEPATGMARVDLLSVSTLLLVRRDQPAERLLSPPRGWHVSEETDHAVTWVRDQPLPTAGGPVWSSSGTDVTVASASARTLRLRVRAVPASGGRVVLSRLAWPGYDVDTGRLGAPTDNYLLTVHVPSSAAGETVTVHFAPPGWRLELLSWWVAVLVGLGWSVVAALRRRQPRTTAS